MNNLILLGKFLKNINTNLSEISKEIVVGKNVKIEANNFSIINGTIEEVCEDNITMKIGEHSTLSITQNTVNEMKSIES
jgi:hypothetical protein